MSSDPISLEVFENLAYRLKRVKRENFSPIPLVSVTWKRPVQVRAKSSA
jgi:hypothetical protein